MIQDKKKELFERLSAKDLDHQFRYRIEHGMGCSPFVSEAICNAAHEVYFPLIQSPCNLKPGQILFQCLSKDNGPTVPIAETKQITVILTLDGGKEDMIIREKEGVIGLRLHRIYRLCKEAYSQSGLLTVEDLAYRIFNVGERTVLRDLAALRKRDVNPPLRSTVKDIGRTISHRAILVKNWLYGDELSDLQRKYSHSFSAIENYLNTFKRVVALSHEGYKVEQIAYMLKISRALADIYIVLWKQNQDKMLPHRRKELLQALQIAELKKTQKRRSNT